MRNLVFIKILNVRGFVVFNGSLIPADDGMFSELFFKHSVLFSLLKVKNYSTFLIHM